MRGPRDRLVYHSSDPKPAEFARVAFILEIYVVAFGQSSYSGFGIRFERGTDVLGPTHRLVGAASGAAAAIILDLDTPCALVCVLAASLGALIPDLDTPNSRSGSTLALNAFLVGSMGVISRMDGATAEVTVRELAAVAACAAALGVCLPVLLSWCLGHRGATHSVAVASLLGAFGYAQFGIAGGTWSALGCPLGVALLGGACGWVVGGILPDSCTVRGVPLLWPLKWKVRHLLPRPFRMKTGGRAELKIVRPATSVALSAMVLFLVAVPAEVRTRVSESIRGEASRHAGDLIDRARSVSASFASPRRSDTPPVSRGR
jgi:membrane-bound metal-dependent hydrolase YbcI (DUF457 family)